MSVLAPVARSVAVGVAVALVSGFAVPAASAAPGDPPGSLAAATLPEVVMVCAPGQTDINFAADAELRAALAVDTPIAQRVVALRPYLAVSDLSVVEGIGPDRLRAIVASRRACATPTSTPPPSAQACQDDRVDLQSASQIELTSRLMISKPTAARLIAARPYAAMEHVTPERVGGVGKGTLEYVVSRSCLTPSPVRTATASWRWAYRSHDTTVTRDDFALRVPAGVLDTSGAWLSITDRSASPLRGVEGPNADFRIWGDWADGTEQVHATLPTDVTPEGADAWGLTNVVMHPLASGDVEILHGARVTVANGKITAGVTSLSPLLAGLAARALIGLIAGGVSTAEATREIVRDYLGTSANDPTCNPGLSSGLLQTEGNALLSNAVWNRPLLKWCIRQVDGSAEWRLANNVAVSLDVQGDNRRFAAITSVDDYGDPLTGAAFTAYNGFYPRVAAYVPPGAVVNVRLPQGTDDFDVKLDPLTFQLLPTLVLRRFGELLDRAGAPDKAGLVWTAFSDCGWTVAMTDSAAADKLFCVVNLLKDKFLESSAARKALATLLIGVDAYLATGDTIAAETSGPFWLRLSYSTPAPTGAPPPSQRPSGDDPTAENTPAGRYIVKVADSRESWVLDDTGALHPIETTSVYYCNALVMKVRYNTPRWAVDQALENYPDAPPATCPDPALNRKFRDLPEDQLPRRVIVRHSNGDSWLVDDWGNRSPIRDGDTYNCLTSNYLVWDQMSYGELLEFPLLNQNTVICLRRGPLDTAGL